MPPPLRCGAPSEQAADSFFSQVGSISNRFDHQQLQPIDFPIRFSMLLDRYALRQGPRLIDIACSEHPCVIGKELQGYDR